MRPIFVLAAALLMSSCGNAEKPQEDGASVPAPVKAALEEARSAADALPPVALQCAPGDDPRGLAFDDDNGGLPAADDVLGLAVGDRNKLPRSEFRRSAETEKAVQFIFPAAGPPQAVVVVTKMDVGWRVHRLDGCRSLTLQPGEDP